MFKMYSSSSAIPLTAMLLALAGLPACAQPMVVGDQVLSPSVRCTPTDAKTVSQALATHFVACFPRVHWSPRGTTDTSYSMCAAEFTAASFVHDLRDSRGIGDRGQVCYSQKRQCYFFLESRQNNTIALMSLRVGQRSPVVLCTVPEARSKSEYLNFKGLTYDDRRDRLLFLAKLCRMGGEPEMLYSFGLSDRKWRKHYEEKTSPYGVEFQATALAYSSGTDQLYIVRDATEKTIIDVWSLSGVRLSRHRIGHVANVDIRQIIPMGQLVVVIEDFPRALMGYGHQTRTDKHGFIKLRSHVIDLRSDEAVASRKIQLPELDWGDGEKLDRYY